MTTKVLFSLVTFAVAMCITSAAAQQAAIPPSFVDTSISARDALLALNQIDWDPSEVLYETHGIKRLDSGRVYRWRSLPYVEARYIRSRVKTGNGLHGYYFAYYRDGKLDQFGNNVLPGDPLETEDEANRYAAAVNRMIWENSPEMQAQLRTAFEATAGSWRAAPVKPPMPDEAHVHQVLAENAVLEKNVDKAIDEYDAALEIFPTWPDGQNNLAFLCGETGDYDCAIEHAQDYLELVPNATDAEAVKDKIIIWKDKLAQEQAQAPPPATTQPVKSKKTK